MVPHDSCVRAVPTVLESIKEHLVTDVIAEITHKNVAMAGGILPLILLESPVDSYLHCISHVFSQYIH